MNDFIPFEINDFLTGLQKWLTKELFVFATLYQLAVIAGLLLLAFPLAAWLRRRVVVPRLREYLPDESSLFIYERKVARVGGPLMAAVLLGLAYLIAKKSHLSCQLIFVAFELNLAWVAVRLLTSFLLAEYWAKFVALIVWTLVALDLANFLQSIISVLDQVGINLEGKQITLWLILKAGVLLVLFFSLANKIITFVEERIKKSEQLRPAVQVLLVKLSKTALYTLALLIALDTVGIDFQYLLVFSGAVGLGLGLGLQKVVANLVSGYILLMDNSIRPGDVIEVEGVYGWIESLHARYISMITRDGTAYLVPNEQLMSNMVINWSFSEKGLRLKIPVGISYGSDVRRAIELMVEVAEDVEDEVGVDEIAAEEAQVLAEALAEGLEPVGHASDRRRRLGADLGDPVPAVVAVGAGDVVPAAGQVLRERPPEVSIYSCDKDSHCCSLHIGIR